MVPRYTTLGSVSPVSSSASWWVAPVLALLLFAAGLVGWLLPRPPPGDRPSQHRLLLRQGVPLVGMAGADVVLAGVAAHGGGRNPADDWVWRLAVERRDPVATVVAVVVTDVGSTVSMGLLAAAAVVVAWCTRRWVTGALVMAVAVGAGALVSAIKVAVGRSRPPVAQRLVTATNQSFPSGHALAAAAILGVLAVAALTVLRGRGARRAVLIAAVALPGAIGASRIYLGVHWATDVLGGWGIGITWLLLCRTLVALGLARRRVRAERGGLAAGPDGNTRTR